MKSSSSSRRQNKAEATVSASSKTEASQSPATIHENKDTPQSQEPVSKERTQKHSTSTIATGKLSESPSKSGTPVQSTSGAASAITGAASRPDTPATAASRNSDSPAPRQARVLRVVDTSKSETPSVASAAASVRRSRKPSMSSVSHPDTPADNVSDYDLYTSASVSRANSPPASRVGSAPVRTMTKSQAKKERKLKAKQAEEAKKEVLSSTPVAEEPVQAPIIGRKRKTKKTPATSADKTGTEHGTSDNTQAASKENKEPRDKPEQKSDGGKKAKSKDKSGKDSKVQQPGDEKEAQNGAQKPAEEEAWRSNNTLEQLIKDAEASGVPMKDLFVERTSSLPTILAQLHQSGELDLNNHPLINPPNLNQRADMRCVAEDYDMLKQPIELTEENRKQLLRGEPVRVNANSGFLKNRCLITPAGCILRHLSFEEEERYLALEKGLSSSGESFQEYPSTSITEPDVTNRGGGLDALFATPEKFGICWVDEAPRTGLTSDSADGPVMLPDPCPTAAGFSNGLASLEADSSRSMNWTMGNTSDIVSATAASVRSFAAATAKQMIGGGSNGNGGGSNSGGSGVIRPADIDDIISMSDNELKTMIEASQREVEVSRKDVDVIDKKFLTLVKRNKKLAQQALGVASELGCRNNNAGAGSGKGT